MKTDKKKPVEKTNKKRMSQSQMMYYALMIIVYLYLGFACMYKYIKYESLDKCVLELLLILTLSLVIEYVHIIKDDGKDIRKNLSKSKNKSIRLKRYMAESFMASIAITAIIFLLVATNRIYINFYDLTFGLYGNVSFIILIFTILSFIDFFIIIFVANYAISEKIVKNNNSKKKPKKKNGKGK